MLYHMFESVEEHTVLSYCTVMRGLQ